MATTWTRKSLPRILLVLGAEGTLREEALAAIKNAASQGSSAALNWVVLRGVSTAADGPALTPADILDEVCTGSMFADENELKVVVVREADSFLSLKDPREILERNIERIPETAVLVLEAATYGPLKNTNFYKGLIQKSAVVECEPLIGKFGDSRELGEEVDRRARARGLNLAYDALQALLERSSKNLGVLEEELDKLVLALRKPGAAAQINVTVDQIEENCAITATHGAFDYVDAVVNRERKCALEVLGAMFDHGMADGTKAGKIVLQSQSIAMMILGALTWKLGQLQDVQMSIDCGREREAFAAAKVPPFKQDEMRRTLKKHSTASLRRCMEALFRANLDMRLGTPAEEAMEQLTWKILKS